MRRKEGHQKRRANSIIPVRGQHVRVELIYLRAERCKDIDKLKQGDKRGGRWKTPSLRESKATGMSPFLALDDIVSQ